MIKALQAGNNPGSNMSFFARIVLYLKSFDEGDLLDFQMGVLQLISESECNEKRRTQVMSHGLHDTSFSQESGGTYTFLQPSLKIHTQNTQYSEPATQFPNHYSQQPSVFSLAINQDTSGLPSPSNNSETSIEFSF
jgi:hypothetical protein